MWKYTKVCVNPRRENTRFHMWKFTWDRVFPHVEIHQKIVNFPTCGNTHLLVYFHMRKFERESEFLHVRLQADLWISAWKKRVGISFILLISACGNTRGYTGKLCHRGKCHSGNCHSGERWMSRPFVHSGNLNFKHTWTNDLVFHNAWKHIICHFIT